MLSFAFLCFTMLYFKTLRSLKVTNTIHFLFFFIKDHFYFQNVLTVLLEERDLIVELKSRSTVNFHDSFQHLHLFLFT